MSLQVFDVSLDVVRSLRSSLAAIGANDRALADQLRRAASSISLNLAEGFRRAGKDRTQFYRIAAGSADEATAALRVALAWGYIEEATVAEALRLLDRVLAMLWRLTH